VSTKTLTQHIVNLDGTDYVLKQGVSGAEWPRESGVANNVRRWTTALLVLAEATGQTIAAEMTCPLTGESFNIFHGGEVDRLRGESSAYTFGNVMLVSIAGNQGRAYAQSRQTDVPQIEAYARLVADGSARLGHGIGGGAGSEAHALYLAGGKRGKRTTVYGDGYRFAAYTRIVEHMSRNY
jgi:hypothetical protein